MTGVHRINLIFIPVRFLKIYSIPSETRLSLFSILYRGRDITSFVYPGWRSCLTYPGLLIFYPFRVNTNCFQYIIWTMIQF